MARDKIIPSKLKKKPACIDLTFVNNIKTIIKV